MLNILLTGATGFIARHLAQKLRKNSNYNVILLTSSLIEGYTCILHKKYSFTIRDFEAAGITRIDYLIHLGAFIPKSGADADDIVRCNLNIENTKYLLENIPMPVKKIVYISTTDVYGKHIGIIDEETMPNPQSLYALSKLYCEKIVQKIAEENGVLVQILRIGHVYGPGEDKYKKFIPVAIRTIKEKLTIDIFTTGEEKRAFLYIEDCCSFIVKAMELKENYGIFNLTSSYSYSIRDIAKILSSFSNDKVIINIQNRIQNTLDFEFDTTKRELYLGEEQISIEDGLRNEYIKFPEDEVNE